MMVNKNEPTARVEKANNLPVLLEQFRQYAAYFKKKNVPADKLHSVIRQTYGEQGGENAIQPQPPEVAQQDSSRRSFFGLFKKRQRGTAPSPSKMGAPLNRDESLPLPAQPEVTRGEVLEGERKKPFSGEMTAEEMEVWFKTHAG